MTRWRMGGKLTIFDLRHPQEGCDCGARLGTIHSTMCSIHITDPKRVEVNAICTCPMGHLGGHTPECGVYGPPILGPIEEFVDEDMLAAPLKENEGESIVAMEMLPGIYDSPAPRDWALEMSMSPETADEGEGYDPRNKWEWDKWLFDVGGEG